MIVFASTMGPGRGGGDDGGVAGIKFPFVKPAGAGRASLSSCLHRRRLVRISRPSTPTSSSSCATSYSLLFIKRQPLVPQNTAEFCLELFALLVSLLLENCVGLSASPPTTTCCRIFMIHSHCSSSAALALRLGSFSKHLFKNSIPSGLNWSFDGNCGGLPCAMLYIIAHSLSKDAQGRRPVLISRMTQPSDQTSIAPWRPSFWPLMTSGDMYIGVPVMDFCLPGTHGAGPPLVAEWSGWRVLPWRAMILAAPKSTYLITPLWSRRMSRSGGQHRGN